ncbi:MAG TPA: hypothetical protein VMN38_03020 [Sphingomicrobium sp.]|nr:hypothetical protein [Sphingomicrobium sp.]
MRRLNPTAIALLAGALVLLLLIYVFAGITRSNTDKLTDEQVAARAASDPETRCGAQGTYDLIKRELFRRAAELRGSNQAAFNQLAGYSVVRMDAPMLKSHDEDIGTITCTGSLALDLPPGVAVVGGRRTLTANVGYAIQPAADGSGDVLTLSNADGVVTPLATLARVGTAEGDPLAPDTPEPGEDPLTAEPEPIVSEPAEPSPPAAAPSPAPAASANPSFNCRLARSRGEIAVCNDAGLAALDRQMASHFNRSMSQASSSERALLERTRGRFIAYRDSCRSDSCIADAYRGRITEIGDIMAGRWRSR